MKCAWAAGRGVVLSTPDNGSMLQAVVVVVVVVILHLLDTSAGPDYYRRLVSVVRTDLVLNNVIKA